MTTPVLDNRPTGRATSTGGALPAVAGICALAAFVAGGATFGDPLASAATPAEAAPALAGSAAPTAALLISFYALLSLAVVGALAARLGRRSDGGWVRMLPVLGTAHLLLMAMYALAPAAAVNVGTQLFDTGVTAGGVETALLLMNLYHPLAAWVGAAFLIAVAVAARPVSRAVTAVSAVLAVGLLLPPVGWAVTYLLPLWFAGLGVWLWRRG